jgi:hypothetical protein
MCFATGDEKRLLVFGHNRSLDCLSDSLSYEAPTAGRPAGGVCFRFLCRALVVVGTRHVTHVANVMPGVDLIADRPRTSVRIAT